ncbi:tRNA threonylcarbamoyladenosine biosynthesis protein TsaE [hydrothermal vent metagenome]|uniref:tRNA threonylcarbamoyladenosine biosynthesis protein TsaE n=1 Tax=hydrothermal vent metagenome TaxID=652676 RepID=A0A3B0W3F4_9ZZZZ
MSEEPAAEEKARAQRVVKNFVTSTARETEELGMRLAKGLSAGSVVALSGELGAGKTVLARGIARGLGVEGYLKSPSFTIVNEYREGRLPLYHIDLYRLSEGAQDASAEVQADELGLEEYLYGDGVCVIEWAERALSLIPDEAVRVTITYGAEPAEEEGEDKKEGTEGGEEREDTVDEARTLIVSFNGGCGFEDGAAEG